ncbi:MAG TPA: acyl-CoA desaturase [Xanthobacteraceae bacterium]|nr:acyl-CoA desaturase [Xanthobacteraceae bacterium]
MPRNVTTPQTGLPGARAASDIAYPSSIPFVLAHLACFAVIWTGITWQAAALGIGLYWLRIFAIGAGYHRYFSHRAYETSRVFQFVLAVMSQTTAQKSVLWWAAKHRHHHLHSDTEEDVHSPRHTGFFYSHLGWIFARRHDTFDMVKVADLARYPELLWLNRLEIVPAFALAVGCYLLAGWAGLVVGFFWSTVAVYHATFCINSLAHVSGRKRYVTGDDSRNNWLLAIFTMGEGWHNNHHAYQSSARQGFKWWEYDATFYLLKGLSWLGLIWNLKAPPPAVLRNQQRLGSRVIQRAALQVAHSFNTEHIAKAVAAALGGSGLATLHARLTEAQHCAAEVLADMHLSGLPSKNEILSRAKSMLAKTPSIDDIANRAHRLVLDAIGSRLASLALQPAT